MKALLHTILSVSMALSLMACAGKPTRYTDTKDALWLTPDYREVTIPYNLAPLNFSINNKAEKYITVFGSKNGKEVVVKGQNVLIKPAKWKNLLSANKGEALTVEVYAKTEKGWIRFPLVTNHIAPEPIDKYVVYRFLPPLYTIYEGMSINQRDLESFDVDVLYDNRTLSSDNKSQCVNCHSFQDYNRQGRMQLHIRGEKGGTIFTQNGHSSIRNLKNPSLVGGAVYPSWHPSMNLIAYSVNSIGQNFYTKQKDKVEVMDNKSDLILYDVDKNKIIPIAITDDWLETFPQWSPDGKYLYYVVAYFKPTNKNREFEMITHHNTIRYNLVRRPFNPATFTFGKTDTLVNARTLGKSATFPRVTPDGRYLLFTMANYGNFHIWHKSSDLYLMDLQTGIYRNAQEINSPDVESYHSWSSNGKWVIFSSRRQDGGYTHFYLAYFDATGRFHKPFVMPQKDPSYYERTFKSFNIPEFTVKPATINKQSLINAMKGDAENAQL